MEEGHKLRNMIAGLSGPQQMTVIEILRENKEHLAQDEEGNVEMEFREFNQKSIDDLKSYVLSVTASSQQQKQPLPGGGSNPASSGVATGTGNGGKDLSGHQNTTNDSDDSDSDDSSSSESSSDSDSD